MLRFFDKVATARPIAKVVDVGCYPGTLLRLLRDRHPQIRLYGLGLGMEQIKERIEDARTQLLEVNLDPDVHFDAYDSTTVTWSIEDESVDIVFSTEVIEHLYNPYNMMEQIARILKPGGLLYLTTDNVANFGAILHILRGGSPNGLLSISTTVQKPKDFWRGHVRIYSQNELQEICTNVGLKIIIAKQFWNKKLFASNIKPLELFLRNHLLWLIPGPYRGHHEIVAQKLG